MSKQTAPAHPPQAQTAAQPAPLAGKGHRGMLHPGGEEA